jgi:pyruvate/2-oxoglutarate dehydrogenase complex dihydrolipoamide acyltransferase (E2) component
VSSSPTERAQALMDVTMPQMGVSVSEGTVAEWKKQVGDAVDRDEPICEISTDKIDTEVPSPAAGHLAEILVAVGETVPVGTVLARLATGGMPAPAKSTEAPEEPGNGAVDAPPPEAPRALHGPAPVRRDGDRRYSPVVRRIAAEHRVDLSQVSGTGRGGRVRKQDVLTFIAGGATAEPPLHIESPYRPDPVVAIPSALGGVTKPLSRMRTAIGEQMRRALDTAAHCTTIFECDMSSVERRRQEAGLTALPLVARAVIGTLREFPSLNATLDGTELTRYDRVHLGIAVSLGEDGLIVPVIHDAQDLTAEGLGRRIKDVATRARSRALSPDEVRGGTFTITNPGAYGAVAATPVINIPQVGILDLEAIVKRAVVITDDQGADAIAIRPMANLCLSWDHRAVDGVYAAQFLAALRKRLEAPGT